MKYAYLFLISFFTFGNETIINNTKYVDRIITKPVYKTKKVYVEKQKANSISVLALQGKFGYTLNNDLVREEYKQDMGLMYQKDVNQFRFTVGGTLRGTGFIGVGLNFD